jgi:hypothetical protein
LGNYCLRIGVGAIGFSQEIVINESLEKIVCIVGHYSCVATNIKNYDGLKLRLGSSGQKIIGEARCLYKKLLQGNTTVGSSSNVQHHEALFIMQHE